MHWSDPQTSSEVIERDFSLDVGGRTVPGVLWQPQNRASNVPLVLLGHGGTTHKRVDYIVALARRLCREHGIAAFAIDGPGHGERGGAQSQEEFEKAWSPAETSDHVVAEWRGALDAVAEVVQPSRVGYWGLSMGTMMGVPVVAAEPRIDVALLGLMGVWGANGDRLADDAPKIACRVRFLMQWDDEIVPRDAALRLFDLLGSEQKALHANPGTHTTMPAAEFRDSTAFLADHLLAE